MSWLGRGRGVLPYTRTRVLAFLLLHCSCGLLGVLVLVVGFCIVTVVLQSSIPRVEASSCLGRRRVGMQLIAHRRCGSKCRDDDFGVPVNCASAVNDMRMSSTVQTRRASKRPARWRCRKCVCSTYKANMRRRRGEGAALSGRCKPRKRPFSHSVGTELRRKTNTIQIRMRQHIQH